MANLQGKRVLLLAPLGQYSEAIAEAMRAVGAVVDCYQERPALNALAKTLIRYSPRLIRSYAKPTTISFSSNPVPTTTISS